MYCPNCGAEILGTNQNFCPNCGSQISKIYDTLQSGSERSQSGIITQPQSIISTKVPAQKIEVRPGLHSRKCLNFALASFIMGIISAVIGFLILIFLFIIGSILLLIVHIIGLRFGILSKRHSKEAAKIEPPNSAEKAGSVFAVFGIIINSILMGIDVIFTIVFLIIILT